MGWGKFIGFIYLGWYYCLVKFRLVSLIYFKLRVYFWVKIFEEVNMRGDVIYEEVISSIFVEVKVNIVGICE